MHIFLSDTVLIYVKRFRSVIHIKTNTTCLLSANIGDMWRPLAASLQILINCTEEANLSFLLHFLELLKFLCIFIDLVGDGAQLHSHISFLWHLFSKRMVRQSVAVSDARRVEQKGVKNVLVHLCAFVIWQWIRRCFNLSFSLWTTKESF